MRRYWPRSRGGRRVDFAEGDLVRSTNEIYEHYGTGRIQRVRGPQAKVEFNPSVFMPPRIAARTRSSSWWNWSGSTRRSTARLLAGGKSRGDSN